MNCHACGAPITLEDLNCPNCGAVNAESPKFRERAPVEIEPYVPGAEPATQGEAVPPIP